MGNRPNRHSEEAQRRRDRTSLAEHKVKELRMECADLRRNLHRAQESARIANEEASARAVAQRDSGAALRAQVEAARAEATSWKATAEEAWKWNRELRDEPLWRAAGRRLLRVLRRLT